MNKDRLLDIECHHEAPTGSNLKHRSCFPKAVHVATRTEAMQLFRTGGGNIRIQPTANIAATLQPEMRKRTLKMLDQDAELRQALLEHARLKQMYADLLAKKQEGHWMRCLGLKTTGIDTSFVDNCARIRLGGDHSKPMGETDFQCS